jgi:tripartite-type tricarboxylate transporter receptor subunit TctC
MQKQWRETNMTHRTKPFASMSKALVFASVAWMAAFSGNAAAEAYPDKPIRIVVPYAPGGSTDITARLIAKSLGARFGQSVYVENRTGAGGAIGHEVVARAPADGYTLLFSAAGPLTVTPHTYPKLAYDPVKGFEPIVLVATQPLLLVVNPDMKVNSVDDLVREAKAKQGKINYGSFGNGSAAHLAGESFKMQNKVNMTHVPYKGSSPALTALMGGEIDLMFDVFSTAAPLVQAGKLRAIAITSPSRSPLFPDVPTMAESGMPGFDAGTWFGVLAPAGTSKQIIDKLNEAMNASLTEKELRSTLASQGAIVRGGSPAEFGAFFADEFQKMGTLVKSAGVKVD